MTQTKASPPGLNGKSRIFARKQSDRLFQTEPTSRSESPVPKVPALTEGAKAMLSEPPPALGMPAEKVRSLAGQADGEQRVRQLAKTTFDCDAHRRRRLSLVLSLKAALEPLLPTRKAIRKQFRAAQQDAKYHEFQAPERRGRLFRLDNWPNLIASVLWATATVTAVVAELLNAVSYITNSGWTDSTVTAAAIGLVYVVIPLAIFHYVFEQLGPVGRNRLNLVFTFVALPAAFVGIYVFATTLGGMQHFDAFSSAAPDASYERLMISSAMLLGVGVIALSNLTASAFRAALSFRLRESRLYHQYASYIDELDRGSAEIEAMLVTTKGIEKEHEASRQQFIDDCVLTLIRERNATARKRADS